VQRYHDRVARRYDASYEDVFWRFHDVLTWEYLKPYLPSDQTIPVMDLGCGTGKWALKLLKSGYRVVCVDISGAMVERARVKITEAGQADRAEFYRADLCDLSALPRGRCHPFAVAMGDVVGCAASPPRALKEVRKRLGEEGIFVATVDNKLAALNFYLESGSAEQFGAFLKTGRTHWLTKDRTERFEIHTYTPKEAVRLFERAGFEVLEVRGKTVLDFRHHRGLLAEGADRRAWMKIEKNLSKDPDALSRAGHLQIAARVKRG